jgi:hypothetical protein
MGGVGVVAVRPGVPVRHLWGLGDSDLAGFPGDGFGSLLVTGRPSARAARLEPWAAVVSSTGGVAASVSPSFTGGLFWSVADAGLVFADNVRDLVRRCGNQVALDADFMRGFAVLDRDMAATRTAFTGINRILPGTTVIWNHQPSESAPPAGWAERHRTVVWCGPAAWPEPSLHGPATPQAYLDAFDASVDTLVDDGPLVVLMSGGLDSTFLAASLVRHATPDRPVHALCHSPHPDADLSAQGRWDPDDYPVAKAMQDAYPGRIIVHQIHSPSGARPLDAAAQMASSRGVPTLNPGNQVWMTHANELAADVGATRLFHGANGNPAYSATHDYATWYYLRHGQLGKAWRSLQREDQRLPQATDLRARAARPLKGALRSHLSETASRRMFRTAAQAPSDYRSLVGLGHTGPSQAATPLTRAGYLEWLTGHGPYSAAGMFAGSLVPAVDPFTTGRMLDTAAAITPLEWLRGPGSSRSYARLLAAGRVPDTIRLRTRRGGQAWDEWYLIRNDRDRYFDEVHALATTPILGGWVDHTALRTILTNWPWGQVHGPDRMSVIAMNRILSLAAFVRTATDWLA